MAKIEIVQRGRPLGSPLSMWMNYRVVPFFAAHLIKLLTFTLRVRRENFEPVADLARTDTRFILAFWHRRLVSMPLAYPFKRKGPMGEPRGVAALQSDSKDGERSTATFRWFGIEAVRGSAGKTGTQALVRMIQTIKQGWDLGITPDGPRGPRQEAKPGTMAVARKTGAWVVPVCVAFDRAWTLRSWDQMLVAKPFAKVTVRYGRPYQVGPGEEETLRLALQNELNELENWAEEVQHG
ncbi:lysophospholipid acyltransferase family protein [Holophaga foetida]|uniref:lysophospholipid acyltransferase family protein n=1 Tax=Holophaga foetida TaxID=35839 RepID=UPI00024732C7|nr:lysophospholipid acyltransferase family protein [Holophaga foetida]